MHYKDFITPSIALIGSIIAIFQLYYLNKNRKADFIHRFKKDFFCESTRHILFLIDLDLLTFSDPQSNQEYPYFKIDKNKLEKLPDVFIEYKNSAKKMNYTIDAFKIDEYLLGHFEDMGLFKKDRVMNLRYIYESFDWYIQITYDNSAIIKYIDWQERQENGEDVYEWFRYIAEQCKKYGKKKNIK